MLSLSLSLSLSLLSPSLCVSLSQGGGNNAPLFCVQNPARRTLELRSLGTAKADGGRANPGVLRSLATGLPAGFTLPDHLAGLVLTPACARAFRVLCVGVVQGDADARGRLCLFRTPPLRPLPPRLAAVDAEKLNAVLDGWW